MSACNRRMDFAHKVLAVFAMMFGAGLPSIVHAGSMELGDVSATYKLTMNYGVGMRLRDPDQRLINGPVDPFELHPEDFLNGAGFTHTGLSKTINQDDGNRNFTKYSLTNNRLSALGEIQLRYQNYGAVISADGFYDWAYHRRNKNNSPETINKSTGPVNEFSGAARRYNGGRARLSDAYIFGNWTIGDDLLLDVRAGNHMVAWGESLFFPGVSSAQSTADATKAFTPGVEIKQILLPTPQLSASLAIGTDLSVMGYFKFAFKPNEIFPVGDFLSPTDSVGPGAEFSYGAVNPLYLESCPGLLGDLSSLCNLGGLGGTLFNAPPNILIPYRGELPNSKYGQYGLGIKYQITPSTTVGLYGLRYTDPNPSVVQHSGFPVIATQPTVLTTSLFNQPTPDYYQVKYYDGIKMLSTSLSTVVGPFNVAGEVSYRKGAAIAVQALELGTINPVFSSGDTVQAQTSAIYATNPHLWFDDLALVAEVGFLHVNSVEKFPAQPGIIPVGNGDTLFYDRNSWAFQVLAIPTKRNIIGGWDLSTPINFGLLVNGNPSMPGSFGALYGEGDMRLSIMANFQYLQNLQIGFGYNRFFGDPDQNIGDSFLKQNPYSDRDNIAINFKYSI